MNSLPPSCFGRPLRGALAIVFVTQAILMGCQREKSTGGNDASAATGGAPGSGGSSSSGGAPGSGGSSNPPPSGGRTGTPSTGGSDGAGGVTPGSGGGSNTGGARATGGASGSSGGSGGSGMSGGNGGSGSGGLGSGGMSSNADAGSISDARDAGLTDGARDASGLSSLLVPAQGALLGAFVGSGTFDQLETTLGRKLPIIHTFVGWTDDYMARVRTDLSAARIPLITWEAWVNGVGTSLDDIINGVHDTMIRTRAQAAKDVGQKFFLRWGHEMNGNWYPWDGFHNGANAAAATKYISAYRHIHDVFTSVGATNVLWIFCPNADSVPGDAWNQWSHYYPGDAYVDWMGLDGYNWGTTQTGSSWRTFPNLVSAIYTDLAAKGKPIMIPETASAETGGDKAAWIASMLPALKGSFPAIKALLWFHMNKETDWRIDSSAQAKTSFVSFANDPYMNP